MNSMIFNHHALPFDNSHLAEDAMPDFLKICVEAKSIGVQTILVDVFVDPSWFRLELAPGYFWKQWYERNKNGKTQDLIRAFRSLTTQTPLFNTIDIDAGSSLIEISLEDKDYDAVRAACWHDVPLVGFSTRIPWSSSLLNVTEYHMDSSEKITSQEVKIIYYNSYQVWQQHLPRLKTLRQDLLSSGKLIVERQKEYYPLITFCGKTEQQLRNWSASLSILEQVKNCFEKLNDFVTMWQSGNISAYNADSLKSFGLSYQVSGESQTIHNDPKLKRLREFWLPDGRLEFFEQHIKMTKNYRLHFYPDPITKSVFIGYVGPHLPLK